MPHSPYCFTTFYYFKSLASMDSKFIKCEYIIFIKTTPLQDNKETE